MMAIKIAGDSIRAMTAAMCPPYSLPFTSRALVAVTNVTTLTDPYAAAIAAAALSRLARDGKFDAARAAAAITELGLNPERMDPAKA